MAHTPPSSPVNLGASLSQTVTTTTTTAELESTNVKVMARCRPFNERELDLHAEAQAQAIAAGASVPPPLQSAVVMEGDTVRVLDADRNFLEREAFQFDHALWSVPESQLPGVPQANPFVDQEEVFQLTGVPAVRSALGGYNGTIFAYGQTGSGKTYTMLGGEDPKHQGIAPRLVRYLFQRIAEEQANHPEEHVQTTVELSFLEIYNEKVKDLLAIAERGQGRSNQGDTGYAECRVRFQPGKGTYVEGLTRLAITSEEHCQTAIRDGMHHRATSSTLMNDTSSRSHAIFQLCLSQKMPLKGTTRVSIINLVDLAGSERLKLSGVTGTALLETRSINLSLSTLRRVIDVLIDNSRLRKGHRPEVPPYRQSLLTWVLSDSLGGNSKTLMVVAVSPYSGNMEDTLSTLRYGLKAKAIVCNARVNEERTTAVVNALRQQMDQLRKQLEEKADQGLAVQRQLESELKQKEADYETMRQESKQLDDLRKQYEEELRAKVSELSKAQEQIAALANVEEERQEKEEELRVAREVQLVTIQQLKEQEDERKRKDAELAAVILRRNSLKRHHDRAAEEEARAKVAAEQAKLRQFVSAFQNAFLLGKQRSGLEELQEEHNYLKERIAGLEDDLKRRREHYDASLEDKSQLQRKVALLEQRCETMHRELEDVLYQKNQRMTELQAQRVEVEEELEEAVRVADQKREELVKLREELNQEQEEVTAKLESMKAAHVRLLERVATKREMLDAARATQRDLEAKLSEVDHTASQYQQQIDQAVAENDEREACLFALQKRKEQTLKQRDDARQLLAKKKQELLLTQQRLMQVSQEADAMKQNHSELREYVSQRFFPVGGKSNKVVSSSSSSLMQPNAAATPMRTPLRGGTTAAAAAGTGVSSARTPSRAVPSTTAASSSKKAAGPTTPVASRVSR